MPDIVTSVCFADDMVLAFTAETLREPKSTLNIVLLNIISWTKKKKLEMVTPKTDAVLLVNRKSTTNRG